MTDVKKQLRYIFKPVQRCLICSKAVESAAYPFCGECSPMYSQLIQRPCGDCGKAVASCRCVKVSPCLNFYRVYEYEGNAAQRIAYFIKQKTVDHELRYLAKLMRDRIHETSGKGINFDCICYVPRNKKGIDLYGFDHARLIAEQLAGLLNIECKPLIKHTGAKGEQKRLSREYRGFAVKTRFMINDAELVNGKLPYRRVLIADDIVTTGTTMGGCAQLLKTCGVKQVFGVAIAHTPSRQILKRREEQQNGRRF